MENILLSIQIATILLSPKTKSVFILYGNDVTTIW